MARLDHYYDLPVYKTCRQFRKIVSEVAMKHFPKKEEYLLKSQVLNSSRSITANIAEGFGRFHHQENVQFCRISRGSLSETLEHLVTAFDEKYISKEMLADLNKEYKTCLKELNGYIKYLKSAKMASSNNK
jgi:four helix bundle protein